MVQTSTVRGCRGAFAGALALAAFVATTVTAVAPADAAAVNRPADPVVLTGAQLSKLTTAKPAQIVGFASTGTGWRQIPVQVDERKVLNFGTVYHGAANNVNIVGYTSNKTWAGKDPNKNFDADDELAFMARDAGVLAAGTSQPVGTKAGTGVRVKITDPLVPGSESYVYLFRKGPGGGKLRSGAGQHYVQYKFKVIGGNARELQVHGRPEPRRQPGHRALLPAALLRPVGDGPDQRQGAGVERSRHPRPAQVAVRAGQLRAQRGHVRRRRGRLHREHGWSHPCDPLVHRREQRSQHAADQRLLRPARGHPDEPAGAHDPWDHGLLRLQPAASG